jgi:hypothetical protein
VGRCAQREQQADRQEPVLHEEWACWNGPYARR